LNALHRIFKKDSDGLERPGHATADYDHLQAFEGYAKLIRKR
jgi:hypothetical protein